MLPETAGHREAVAAFRKKRHPTIEINDREATPLPDAQASGKYPRRNLTYFRKVRLAPLYILPPDSSNLAIP
jgi:hypothetical protein